MRAVAFDCYGTLIDFDERAFVPAIRALFARHGVAADAGAVWDDWIKAAREFAKTMGIDPERPLDGPEPPFRTFQESWPLFFGYALDLWKVGAVDAHAATAYLLDALGRAPAYEESREVVDGIRAAGVTVAVASNADRGHLAAALRGAEISADVVVSSEDVRAYKPRRPFYEALLRALDLSAAQVLYVGDHPIADVTGARSVGMPVYRVQRFERETPSHQPAFEATWTFPDLRGLLRLIPAAAP
ncbi:MAG: HAD family hydrolase [Chloroflexi bacterium]|nr:HAD family hydrolase [Chloroflexota bacterium]